MRTSKISQDTSRIMNALGPRRSSARTAATESLRSSTPRSLDLKIEHETAIKAEDKENEVENLSEIPTRTTPRKRKRSTSGTPPMIDDIEAAFPSPDGLFPRPTRRQPSKHIKGPSGEVTVLPPPNWERIWQVTAAMRARRVAPVDTMGCESLAEDTRSPLDRRLQTLVALMLSSQTKDPVTAAAMRNLQENLPGGFTLDSLLECPPDTLNGLIAKVGFHNNKTKFIKRTAEILRDDFAGDIPDTIEGLISLPGVGPKMAYLTMSAAWDRHEGIGVDVHVHRITNLLGWHKTRSPEETRAELEAWLPRELWHPINHLLVGFGQTYCPPVGRRCENCDLAKEGLCPSAVVPKELKVKRVKKEKVEVESEEVLVKADADAPALVLGDAGEVEGDAGVKREVVVEG